MVHSFLSDEQYRAERRAVSREARRRRRRAAAPAKARPSEILRGKVLEPEKVSAPAADESPAAESPAEHASFMEVTPEGEPITEKEVLATTPPVARGARVAQSVMRPPKLTTPLPSDSGVWAPTVEAISQQADTMSEQVEVEPAAKADETVAEEPISVDAEPVVSAPAAAEGAAAAKPPTAPVAEAPDVALEAEAVRLAAWLAEQYPDASEVVRNAAELLDRQAGDDEAMGVYQQALDECDQSVAAEAATPAVRAVAAALQIHLHNPEAANGHIENFRQEQPGERALVLWLYSRLTERYPQYVPALKGRGQLYCETDRTDLAIADLETAIVHETSDEPTLNRLEQLYRKKLETVSNPALEFKLVKLYLKMSRLDDAISILQRLVNDSSYEQRAVKILGLCFWQKNMYYLAWQKFKQLPVTDDIKDILYRLASDMEAADQLTNAKYALERILESDFGYKDVEARLKQINHRLRLQQEELAQTKIPASAEVLQDTRFVILNEINRGSMGVVYRARDKVLDEIVALKVLNDYLCADPQAVQRFKREARAAKRLSHPYIVRIHEFYESAGKKFLSMEYIEGRDLKSILLESGRLSPAEVKKYFSQMCSALQYAHELDIVHRDIKPANIMITTQGAIKITDFGIAKILKTEDVTRSSSMIMGTPLYMAPEQIEGGNIDGRCDIYSLGIMLYETISGQPPFTEGNIEYHHIHTPVPPLPDDVSESLKAIVYKCVEKRVESRFQTPGELLVSLEELGE